MSVYKIAQFIILFNLGTLPVSLACPTCPYPTPPTEPPKLPPPQPPRVKPPYHPKPPVVKPPPAIPKPPPYVPKPPPYVPKPPVVEPPIIPKPPIVHPPIIYPPVIPKPPIVYPPVIPTPPIVPKPPVVYPPPPKAPCPPPPPPPPKATETCPINTFKLSTCVDMLGGLVYIGIGQSAKDACCPVLEGLGGLDAAVCLCTTIKSKVLNVNILIPIALQVIVDCGKTPPSGFQCPT